MADPSDPQIPQLTDLGERLAQDKERKYLASLLEGLVETPNVAPNVSPNATPNVSFGADKRQEALKSARHILQTVWSMQHMDKISKQP